jgi:hypothetical protein
MLYFLRAWGLKDSWNPEKASELLKAIIKMEKGIGNGTIKSYKFQWNKIEY